MNSEGSGASSRLPNESPVTSFLSLTLNVERCQEKQCPNAHELPEATCYCRTCRRLLCNRCRFSHMRSGHAIGHWREHEAESMTVQRSDICHEHPEERVSKVCRRCRILLCGECPGDYCPTFPEGPQGHRTHSLREAVLEQEQSYIRVKKEAETNIAYADSVTETELDEWNQTNSSGLQLTVAKIREIGERHRQKMNEALDRKISNLSEEATEHYTARLLDVPSATADLRSFSTEIQQLMVEADNVMQQSHISICRTIPRIMKKMSAPVPVDMRRALTLEIKESTDEESLPPRENLVATLNLPVLKHRVLKVLSGHGQPPWDIFSIVRGQSPSLLVEVSTVGFFVTDASGKRRQMLEAGIYGACASKDGKLIHGACRTVIRTFSFDESGLDIHLVRTLHVPGAKFMQGAAMSATTGELAVIDTEQCRVTFHEPEQQQMTKSLELGQRSPEPLLGHPRYLAWSQCGRDLFISDRGNGPFEASVVRFRIDPPTIIWRRPCLDPWNVIVIGDRVYVTRLRLWSTRMLVISAESGRVLSEVLCEGKVRGVVHEENSSEYVTVSYVQKYC